MAASAEGGGRLLEVCKGLAVCALGGGALTGALIGGHQPAAPVAHRKPTARVVHHVRDIGEPRHAPAPVDIVPSAPAPRSSTRVHSPESTPVEHRSKPEAAPQVEAAAPAAGTQAAHHDAQEAVAEEQFGDFDATEAGGGATPTASVADSATPATATSGSGAERSPKRREEEAGAAEQFHGLLE
jgi:hypothetical protein